MRGSVGFGNVGESQMCFKSMLQVIERLKDIEDHVVMGSLNMEKSYRRPPR